MRKTIALTFVLFGVMIGIQGQQRKNLGDQGEFRIKKEMPTIKA